MSELVVVAIVSSVAILALSIICAAVIMGQHRERLSAREERMRLTLQLMSRNAAEYSLAQEKIDGKPRPERELVEPPVGL